MCIRMGTVQRLPLSQTLSALIWSELRAMSRTWRAVLWTSAVPVLILLLGEAQIPANLRKSPVPTLEIVALAVTVGVFALALFGYSTSLATYRERGVFDRLRCAPVGPGQLLGARLVAQMVAVALQGIVVLAVAWLVYHAVPTRLDLAPLVVVWVLGGLCALALGQMVVALTRRAGEAVAAARLILITVFLLSGTFVSVERWPGWLRTLASWSPVNLLEHLLTRTLLGHPLGWDVFGARLLALGAWAALLALVGTVFFRWDRA